MYWLAVELYGWRSAGWIAVALLALSPVSVALAQDAREYSLWSAATIALALSLLVALRRDDLRAWSIVAVLTALSCYVDGLTIFLVIGLAAYAAIVHRRRPHTLAHCALSLGAGLLAFAPWLWLIAVHRTLVSRALVLAGRNSPLDVIRTTVQHIKVDMLDYGVVRASLWSEVTTVIALAAIVAAFGIVFRYYPARAWLFVVLPVLLCALPFVVADFAFPGERVREVRYFMPCFLFIDLAFAGAFAALLATRPKLSAALLAALLLLCTASIATSSQAVTWWSTQLDQSLSVIPAINQSKHPLIVSDNYLLYSVVLANYLRPDVAIVVRPRCFECSLSNTPSVEIRDVPHGPFSEVFALGPSPKLQTELRTWARSQHPPIPYTCINVRGNCRSRLNVEPQF